MKKKIIFILVLFLGVTGFNGESRIVEQSNVNFHESVSLVGYTPQILIHLKDDMVDEGFPVTFSAKVTPSDCTVEWFKNGEKILAGERFKFSFIEGIATFVIMYTLPGDGGIYSVKFTNMYGEATSMARLFVRLRD